MSRKNALLPHIKLRFNIEHPNLEECYAYGYECALAEISEDANPYQSGSAEYDQWAEGWWAGFYGEKPLYELAELLLEPEVNEKEAANDYTYNALSNKVSPSFLSKVLKITGAIAATAVVGYQVLDLVA
ncbi:transmission trait enhancer LetE [Legionella clemsonensis]|uniref:Transmission trait enhancer protein LetE n=1 Tax=Legionella clemsonensis TaxID=1867846 RepID=A0A222NZ95_9GAMM|nr:transmission trait enhancer LetE [Legionella clemsonensis]ASQ44912.1 hypothetical protein clem_01740 [Legionella clemsonensis]